ncbi:MAG: carboxypeptidase-like regulatory domain-containing protein [Mucilaginibacter sp.]|nr:carboxypeptidase-like regulatory domain-containing protein [Mucilaginibacter sp.]
MKPICRLLFIFILLININVLAQGRYSVSGTIADESGTMQKGATVFISGSQKITTSDDAGQFEFTDLDPGTYQLSVKLLGFYPYTENIQVHDKPVKLNIKLKVKTVVLNEVVIGNGDNWAANYAIFKAQFLGTSDNAKQCVITNPRVVSFGSAGRNVLTAEADEFLIIENNKLGYRVHYLLKDFKFDKTLLRTKYDGDTNFEELEGPPEMKMQWAQNRLAAYQGSLMHYLRSVYTNTTVKEGFLTYQLYELADGKLGMKSLKSDNRLLKIDTITTVIDTSFISLKFTAIQIDYDPEKAASIQKSEIDSLAKFNPVYNSGTYNTSSILKLYLPKAIIDRKGNYTDYRTFLCQGNWGKKRIGDQLPFEYQPPIVTQ